MLVKCEKGLFHLVHNFRNAFDETAFCEKYLEECFDQDSYIVGDIAAGILRLKGFNDDPKAKNYYGFIEDYLEISCVIGSPYFILKRISEDEYNKLYNDNEASATDESGFLITPITKENFDKESLQLKSNPKQKPRINLDMNRINAIPKGHMPEDLKEDITTQSNRRDSKTPEAVKKAQEEVANTQTYVSSSNGFDPSKVQNRPRGFNAFNDSNKNNGKNNQNKSNNQNAQNNKNKSKNPNQNKNVNQNKNNSSDSNQNQKGGNNHHNHNKKPNKKNFKPDNSEVAKQ